MMRRVAYKAELLSRVTQDLNGYMGAILRDIRGSGRPEQLAMRSPNKLTVLTRR